MAWIEGAMTTAAGQLKAILDAQLPLNAYWHIEDPDAGANIGVYHNLDAARNSDFILQVGDNQANYAMITMWQGWDSGAHAGTGQSVGGQVVANTIRKTTGAWGLALHDLDFSFVNRDSGWHYYLGQTKRWDETKNMPMIILHSSVSANNPVGSYSGLAGLVWELLFDKNGVARIVNPMCWLSTSLYFKTSNGNFFVPEWPVYETTNSEQIGLFNGCSNSYTTTGGLINLDTITDENNVKWLVLVGNGKVSYCRMN